MKKYRERRNYTTSTSHGTDHIRNQTSPHWMGDVGEIMDPQDHSLRILLFACLHTKFTYWIRIRIRYSYGVHSTVVLAYQTGNMFKNRKQTVKQPIKTHVKTYLHTYIHTKSSTQRTRKDERELLGRKSEPDQSCFVLCKYCSSQYKPVISYANTE